MQRSTQVLFWTILVLGMCATIVGVALLGTHHPGQLRVTFLNIGQGDAIVIETPSGVQMLVDGGKNRAVIRELSRVLPLFDRSIDVVLATHPDADHIGGLPDVLKRYRVGLIVHSSVRDPEGADADAFDAALTNEKEEGAVSLVASRGQVIDLGDGVTFEILFPDRDVAGVETNLGSIVGRLQYGATSFLLTGDSPDEVEKYLVLLDADELRSTVLKAGHHGSRTSSSLTFVGFVQPEYGVFSRGCNNSYGHPHEEVVATFARFGVTTLDTCTDGRISFVSDGMHVTRE